MPLFVSSVPTAAGRSLLNRQPPPWEQRSPIQTCTTEPLRGLGLGPWGQQQGDLSDVQAQGRKTFVCHPQGPPQDSSILLSLQRGLLWCIWGMSIPSPVVPHFAKSALWVQGHREAVQVICATMSPSPP